MYSPSNTHILGHTHKKKQNNGNRQRKQLESCHLMIQPDKMIQRFVWPHSNPGKDYKWLIVQHKRYKPYL